MLNRPGADVLRHEGGFDGRAGHDLILASAPAGLQRDCFDSRGSACLGESSGDEAQAANDGTSPPPLGDANRHRCSDRKRTYPFGTRAR